MRTQVIIYSAGKTPIDRLLQDLPDFDLTGIQTLSPCHQEIYRSDLTADIPGVLKRVYVQVDGIEAHLPFPDKLKQLPFGFHDSFFDYLHKVEKDSGIIINNTRATEGKFFSISVTIPTSQKVYAHETSKFQSAVL